MPRTAYKIENPSEWAVGVCRDAEPETCALFEGIRITGFARVHKEGFEFPPKHAAALHIASRSLEIPWDLFWDIRVFSKNREVHAWRTGAGQWFGREATDAGPNVLVLTRKYKLWGTSVVDHASGWDYWSERRGPGVWLPHYGEARHMLLHVDQVVERDNETGLAIVVDAIVREIVREQGAQHDTTSN